ncbi:amidohydrolase [Nigerium massiliense]|uniref:amidohydrolase n=1 Tax=Nigerium massiliense TaxID=1522317 RepID=UPI00069499E7|nr:amidohydrolase family protein [Nigerium massiliense]
MTTPTQEQRAPLAERALLIRNALVVPLPGGSAGLADSPAERHAGEKPVDIRIAAGVITEVGPSLVSHGEDELDAAGRWAIPGLWDQHVHFLHWARARGWLDVADSASQDDVVDTVRAHVATSTTDPDQVLIAFGYRAALWPAPASVPDLDAVSAGRPVIAIAGDAHNGWLNTRAQRMLGVGPFTTAVSENAWFEINARLPELPGFEPQQADLVATVSAMAAQGLTGIVDLDFRDAFTAWPRRVASGLNVIRVSAGVYPEQLDEAVALGVETGGALPGGDGLITMGPLKIITDGSLSTRTAWCCAPYTDAPAGARNAAGAPNVTADRLDDLIATATAHGLAVTAHAIGDRANEGVLDAFARAGIGGRIEHAQLLRCDDIGRFAELGVTASVQPAHLLDDRDTAERCWADRTARCFPLRSLLAAGVDVVFGSDGPVSPVDPWLEMAAAVHRSADEREGWHEEQSLSPAEALACSVDGQRLEPGCRGDVVLLGADPLAPASSPREAAEILRTMSVAATVCAGRVTYCEEHPSR